ncbi:hypothetical protein L288_02140 [Sphingobium quisquiliarum P25]|uniref:Uncharacterized protein n=1 Tax=Sphingobium quisquiliarum P25 TaxID=1329909 RepID=T0HNQ0_9SPHN|nr:hypothetical protein L288_02140 [Sphingobium quisquiliarum P25]
MFEYFHDHLKNAVCNGFLLFILHAAIIIADRAHMMVPR